MGPVERVQAVAVRSGRIVAVGGVEQCRAALGLVDTEVNLFGACLIPGFVDPCCRPLGDGETQGRLIASGVTSVGVSRVCREEMQEYLRTRDAGGLRLRVSVCPDAALLDSVLALGLTSGLGDDRFRVQDVGLRAPKDARDTKDAKRFAGMFLKAHSAGLQTTTLAGSAYEVGLVLEAVEKALTAWPRSDARHRIEVAVVPDSAQLKRSADLGIHAVLSLSESDAVGTVDACAAFKTADVSYALRSDVSPLATIARVVPGGPESGVGILQALRAHTVGGAGALHRDAEVGSLEPGKSADFVILTADPTTCEPDKLTGIDILQTWIGGELVHDGMNDPSVNDNSMNDNSMNDNSVNTGEADGRADYTETPDTAESNDGTHK
jgi:predicted amidohydrolase YtcJ